MALSDPTGLTINAVATDFDRISSSENRSIYKDATGNWTLTVSHAYGKRARRVLRLDWQKTGANPLFPDQNQIFSAAAYFVLDQPLVGLTASELQYMVEAVADYLTVAANAQSFIQGQN